jgi:hypothetical protein
MKDLMMLYGVTLGRRYSRGEKVRFVEAVAIFFTELGYSIRVQSKQDAFSSTNNLIIGDIKKAKRVFLVAYDTPATITIPNYRYFPFNPKRNLRNESIDVLINFAIASLSFIIMFFLLKDFGQYELWKKIVTVLVGILLTWMAYDRLRKKGNRINFNRNSASIALLCELAKSYKGKNVAFVMLDQTVNSYLGLKLLREEMTGDGKVFILLDCLAKGEELVIVCKGNVNSELIVNNGEDLKIYQKDFDEFQNQENILGFFPNMLYMASGSNEEKQFVVRNTRSKKDYDVDMDRLETIHRILLTYLKGE